MQLTMPETPAKPRVVWWSASNNELPPSIREAMVLQLSQADRSTYCEWPELNVLTRFVWMGWPAPREKPPGTRGPKKRLDQYELARRRRLDLYRRLVKLPGLRKGDSMFADAVLETARGIGNVGRALAGQVHETLAQQAEEDTGWRRMEPKTWARTDPQRPPSRSQVGRILAAFKRAGQL